MSDEKPTEASAVQQAETLRFERDANFNTIYANNVQVESTAWDVTLVFGQFDKRSGAQVVNQRVAVTMAWAEAKAVLNLAFGNMTFYEGINGRIRMPAGMTPPVPDLDVTNPILKKVKDRLEKIRDLFYGED